jgi:nucleoside-diphosphate-sugar epimerase
LLSFIYVSDLAKAVIKAMESAHAGKGYFISDGGIYTTGQFTRFIKRNLNRKTISLVIPPALVKPIAFSIEKLPLMMGRIATINRERMKEYEAVNWSCDSAPLQTELDFTPEFDLEKGIHETVKWYKKEKWL